MEVKTITSEKGLNFLVHQNGNLIYIGLSHEFSWLGQILVYDAVSKLDLQTKEKFANLKGVNSIEVYLGDHTISEIESALRHFAKVA